MSYGGPLRDTLLVVTTDLQTLPGLLITDMNGLIAPGTRRGANAVVPRKRGQKGAPKEYDAFPFSISVSIAPEDEDGNVPASPAAQRGRVLTNLRILAALLEGNKGQVPIARRLTNSAGTGTDEESAAGEFVDGLRPVSGFYQFDLVLQFINLDGGWWDGTTWRVP